MIKIAQLSVDICKTSLIKKTALIRLINLNADDNITDDDKVFDELQDNQQFLQLLPVVVTNSDIAPKQENNIHYNNGKPIFCKKQSMGFLF